MMFKCKKNLLLSLFLLLLTIIYSGCGSKQVEPISKEGLFLGTFCNITIYDKVSPKVLDKAYERINQLENKMSINKKSTEVISINNNSGNKFVKVSNDTFNVIKKSIYYSKMSNGHFDVTIGPIVKLWNIGTDKARVPSKLEINSKLPLVNYKNIILDEKNHSIMLKQKEMIIDLGAIAKGYVADEVRELLESNGIHHALINLGGNIVTIGKKNDNSDWKLGIQNPFDSRGEYFATINCSNTSIVTSGVYERFFEKNGKKYHHILGTKTGYPIDNSLVSVSIITNKSVNADALSTTTFSLGLKDGLNLVNSLDGVEAIFVTKDHNVFISSGLKGNFTIKNNEFKLKN